VFAGAAASEFHMFAINDVEKVLDDGHFLVNGSVVARVVLPQTQKEAPGRSLKKLSGRPLDGSVCGV
jgi:hypothetical protein